MLIFLGLLPLLAVHAGTFSFNGYRPKAITLWAKVTIDHKLLLFRRNEVLVVSLEGSKEETVIYRWKVTEAGDSVVVTEVEDEDRICDTFVICVHRPFLRSACNLITITPGSRIKKVNQSALQKSVMIEFIEQCHLGGSTPHIHEFKGSFFMIGLTKGSLIVKIEGSGVVKRVILGSLVWFTQPRSFISSWTWGRYLYFAYTEEVANQKVRSTIVSRVCLEDQGYRDVIDHMTYFQSFVKMSLSCQDKWKRSYSAMASNTANPRGLLRDGQFYALMESVSGGMVALCVFSARKVNEISTSADRAMQPLKIVHKSDRSQRLLQNCVFANLSYFESRLSNTYPHHSGHVTSQALAIFKLPSRSTALLWFNADLFDVLVIGTNKGEVVLLPTCYSLAEGVLVDGGISAIYIRRVSVTESEILQLIYDSSSEKLIIRSREGVQSFDRINLKGWMSNVSCRYSAPLHEPGSERHQHMANLQSSPIFLWISALFCASLFALGCILTLFRRSLFHKWMVQKVYPRDRCGGDGLKVTQL